MDMLLQKYAKLNETIKNLLELQSNTLSNKSENKSNESSIGILQTLVTTTKNNSKRQKNGYQYDDTIKCFASYIKLLEGQLLDETLHSNLNTSLPSPSSVNRYFCTVFF